MLNINQTKTEIVESLKPLNVESIIIFGSYAHGNATESSDLDLYVVTSDDFIPKSWNEKRELTRKVSRYLKRLRERISVDLLVHTKAMKDKFYAMNSSFSRELQENGVVVYEK